MTRDRWPWSFYRELIYRQKQSCPNKIEHSWKTVKTPSSRQVVQTKNQPPKTIMYCRNRWPHRFLLLLIWRDEWISSSSNFSSLSQVFICPFFFPLLLFSFLNPSHLSSFRPIRHTLIFGVLPPHSPPHLYRVTFILLLSSLQSSSITSSIPPFSVAFSSRHIYHTSALIFLPPSVLPGRIFQSWFPLLIVPFSPLLLLKTYKTFNIHHVIWPMCVCVEKSHKYGVKRCK